MPSTPKPVVDPRFGPAWTPIIQAAQRVQQVANATAAVAPGLGSQHLLSAANTGTFTPTNVNDAELMSSPTVTVQVGTSGQVLLLATSTINVVATNGNSQAGLIFYSYTPAGGSQVGPGTQVIARLSTFVSVSGSPTPTVNLSQTASVAGSILLSQLPAGPVTFNLYAESNGPIAADASFQNTELIAWPL